MVLGCAPVAFSQHGGFALVPVGQASTSIVQSRDGSDTWRIGRGYRILSNPSVVHAFSALCRCCIIYIGVSRTRLAIIEAITSTSIVGNKNGSGIRHPFHVVAIAAFENHALAIGLNLLLRL